MIKNYILNICRISAASICSLSLLSACSMGEELRRIEAAKQAKQMREASRSSNLNGEQLFVRSCNTCHPAGKAGMGPRLDQIDLHYQDDAALKKFLRSGKGMMPGQPEDSINDEEMSNLIVYLRSLSAELKEDK
ncbi:MAG: cytochrome c [Candidatus Obscuribacterales bacterium]|nr:cytochrome c [Candidatus Obscuribacterales bacterium]